MGQNVLSTVRRFKDRSVHGPRSLVHVGVQQDEGEEGKVIVAEILAVSEEFIASSRC